LVALKPSGRVNIHVERVRQELSIEATEYVVSFALLLLLALLTTPMRLLSAPLPELLLTLSLMLVVWVPGEVEVLNLTHIQKKYYKFI
jgi:NhaP-type Na+/H+ and K+/H+ antiporter